MSTKITHVAVVPYSCEQMFALVNNIEAYQQFVPYCQESIVHLKNDQFIEATLTLEVSVNVPFLGKKYRQQAFKTRNKLHPNKQMDMSLLEGPMDKLAGTWRFEALEDGRTKVLLDLDIAFSSAMWTVAFNAVSGQVASTLVNAFIKRADELYGVSGGHS